MHKSRQRKIRIAEEILEDMALTIFALERMLDKSKPISHKIVWNLTDKEKEDHGRPQ